MILEPLAKLNLNQWFTNCVISDSRLFCFCFSFVAYMYILNWTSEEQVRAAKLDYDFHVHPLYIQMKRQRNKHTNNNKQNRPDLNGSFEIQMKRQRNKHANNNKQIKLTWLKWIFRKFYCTPKGISLQMRTFWYPEEVYHNISTSLTVFSFPFIQCWPQILKVCQAWWAAPYHRISTVVPCTLAAICLVNIAYAWRMNQPVKTPLYLPIVRSASRLLVLPVQTGIKVRLTRRSKC